MILRNIIKNLLLLLLILAIVIAVTGIPMDYNVTSTEDGINFKTIGMEELIESVKNNFRIFFNGEIFNVEIQGDTSLKLLGQAGRRSFIVLFGGTILALLIGIPKGIIDSRKNNKGGTFKLLQSLIPLSIPDVLIIAIVQFIAIYFFHNNIAILGSEPIPTIGDESLRNIIYPILSISIIPAAFISRIVATEIEDSFTKPYILAARGKGCSKYYIIIHHMMKNIFYSILSGFATVIGIMFSSLIIIERLFVYRGIGFYLIYFYTSGTLQPYDAGLAFTLFVVALAVTYYFVFMLLNGLKEIILFESDY